MITTIIFFLSYIVLILQLLWRVLNDYYNLKDYQRKILKIYPISPSVLISYVLILLQFLLLYIFDDSTILALIVLLLPFVKTIHMIGHGHSHQGHEHKEWEEHGINPKLYDMIGWLMFGSRSIILDVMNINNGETIVDIGCGTGVTIIEIKWLNPECTVYGIDPSEGMLERARENRLDLDVNFLVGGADNVKLGNGIADHVIMTFSFHHFPENIRVDAMKEAKRLLKKGGRITVFEFPGAIDGVVQSLKEAGGFDNIEIENSLMWKIKHMRPCGYVKAVAN